MYYKFTTEIEPITTRKVKIEINTREHFSVHKPVKKDFFVDNPWFKGKSSVLTYPMEELLGTKLRALYQRKKGRDLYDFWYAMKNNSRLDAHAIVTIFDEYMKNEDKMISRSAFEENLALKQKSPAFNGDVRVLLSSNLASQYDSDEAYKLLFQVFLTKLNGEAWNGL